MPARVNEGIMAGKTAVVSTRMGKPSLIFGGFQYRNHRQNSKLISWVCVKDKCGKCKGKLKTTLQYEIFSKTDHSCVPNLAGMEVKVKLENCIKRAREDLSVPVHTVYKEELSDTYAKGYDMVTEIPKYESVKSRLCKERRKVLGTEQNPEDSSKTVF
jgi:hypothetical protein